MENCAKRWQTREGTYQLKRRRLPDVRDSPEYPGADIDMEDKHGGLLHGGREHLRGWEGRFCFTLFHLVYKFPWLVCLAWCLAFVWVLVFFGCVWFVWVGVVFCFGFCSQGDLIAIYTNSSSWPTMSRTSPALQEKNIGVTILDSHWVTNFVSNLVINLVSNLVTILVSHFCDQFGDQFGFFFDHFVLTFGDHFCDEFVLPKFSGYPLFEWMEATARAERPLIWQSCDEYVFAGKIWKFVLSDIPTSWEMARSLAPQETTMSH